MTQHYAMLQRNLLYTGVTRGKRLVVLVGQKKAVAIAVRNVSGRRRWSKLQEWLRPEPVPLAADWHGGLTDGRSGFSSHPPIDWFEVTNRSVACPWERNRKIARLSRPPSTRRGAWSSAQRRLTALQYDRF